LSLTLGLQRLLREAHYSGIWLISPLERPSSWCKSCHSPWYLCLSSRWWLFM